MKHKFELQFLSSKGEFAFLSFKYDFQVGSYTAGSGENEKVCHSMAAVIDGTVLHCTPLSKFCPPPPMSHFQAKFSGQIVDLFFGKNSVGAIILEGRTYKAEAYSYDWEEGVVIGQISNVKFDFPVSYPRLSGLIQVPETPDFLAFVTGSNKDTGIIQIGVSLDHYSVMMEPIGKGIALGWTASPSAAPGEYKVAFIAYDGSVQSYPIAGLQLELPVDSHHITKLVDFKDREGRTHFACLTESNHLYVDRELVADSCTSFFCAEGFFLFTVMTQGMFDMLFLFSIKDLAKARAAVGCAHLGRQTGQDFHRQGSFHAKRGERQRHHQSMWPETSHGDAERQPRSHLPEAALVP